MAEQLEPFRYDKMVEKALRGVVQSALQEVIDDGLVDDHHFYITFRTDMKGVEIPDYLMERYPGEMTIVLQHQFYDLEARPDEFSVMLSFNNVPEHLKIPYNAITIFADPSVNFALQFQPLESDDFDEEEFEHEPFKGPDGEEIEKTGEVVSLETFREKKTNDDD